MAEWRRVASASDVKDGEVKQVVIEGHPLGIYKVEGKYYACDDICTHAFAILSEGYLDGHSIECPLHQGCFDVRTGKALNAPVTSDIRTYPVKVEGSDLKVEFTLPAKKA
jgi:nitrite reductase/ring-hydroxylating ferredoxin subunit